MCITWMNLEMNIRSFQYAMTMRVEAHIQNEMFLFCSCSPRFYRQKLKKKRAPSSF